MTQSIPCKHTMPIGAVVIVDSVLPSLRCTFCEVEELRAEVARLKKDRANLGGLAFTALSWIGPLCGECRHPERDEHEVGCAAKRDADAFYAVYRALTKEPTPTPEPQCAHPVVGLISPEAWAADLFNITPGMVRAIQTNARTAAIEEAKAAIVNEAAERPLNAQIQEYAKGFAEVLEALKSQESA